MLPLFRELPDEDIPVSPSEDPNLSQSEAQSILLVLLDRPQFDHLLLSDLRFAFRNDRHLVSPEFLKLSDYHTDHFVDLSRVQRDQLAGLIADYLELQDLAFRKTIAHHIYDRE